MGDAGYLTADLLIDLLIDHGASQVFGLPGSDVMEVLDAIARRSDRLRYIGVRHEQAAAHMADGFARVTGRPGVCLTTRGPGAINLLNGIAAAWKDGFPLIAISGGDDLANRGKDTWHEVDVQAMFAPVTKAQYVPRTPDEVVQAVSEAFWLAMTGKPGPVHIELAKDLAKQGAGSPPTTPMTQAGPPSPIDDDTMGLVSEQLARSRRAVAVLGGGVVAAGAVDEARSFVERLALPVILTPTSRGVLADDHALYLGLSGMFPRSQAANRALREADLVLGIGTRFSDQSTANWTLRSPDATVIQISINPADIGRAYPINIGLVADAGEFLRRARTLQRTSSPEADAWLAELIAQKPGPPNAGAQRLSVESVHGELSAALPKGTIVATSGGNGFSIPIDEPRTFLNATALGTMGFALPAAIAAKAAQPDRFVVVISGDGDFAMNIMEIETAVRERIGLLAIVLNNFGFNAQRIQQRLAFDNRQIGSSFGNPDFVALARLFGAKGVLVERPADIASIVQDQIGSDQPTIAEVRLDPQEIPAGIAERVGQIFRAPS